MGSVSSIPEKMNANMRVTSEEQLEKGIEQRKVITLQSRETQMAFIFAKNKERFHWYGLLYSGFTVILPVAQYRGHHYLAFTYVLSTFSFWYQYDMYYGNKMERVRNEAERLLDEEPHLFRLPENNQLCNDEEYDTILDMDERPRYKHRQMDR